MYGSPILNRVLCSNTLQWIKIGDRTKVWNVLALQPPTDAPEELLELYKDQISFLNIIVCEDEENGVKKANLYVKAHTRPKKTH